MKRIIALAASLMILIGCGGNAITVGGLSSKYFNNDDYDAAVQEVMAYIDQLEGCTLKEISYAGDDVIKAEADTRGLGPEQIIVLESVFVTDKEDHHNGLEPDHTYEGYRWILVRNTKAELWEIIDQSSE